MAMTFDTDVNTMTPDEIPIGYVGIQYELALCPLVCGAL